MERKKNTVIVVAGPTAAGKTAMAIRLAQLLQTEIISADSRQCYRELSIGTAKPSPEELAAVHHYFINSHSIKEEVNAGTYEQLALGYAAEIFQKRPVAVVCGGTGLYIKAFCEGMDAMPKVPAETRERIRRQYEVYGIDWLQSEIKQKDAAFFEVGEIQNPQRLMRALEIIESTGQSILSFRKSNPVERDFNILKVGVTLPKTLLHENIHLRVDKMMDAGLVEEVRSVQDYRQHNALQTVGYTEIFNYFDGKLSIDEAVEQIKTHTRQYAKRQLTWFRKDTAYHWFDAREPGKVLEFVKSEL
ncbi:tRNA (adenosine(37)-N6)-dimethylallyltransferase MiaA [Chitinophaga caeni]|uniref:tRNA dimethylallyltransferase n=1 Tax=Chitinophaga caeni TaxID=2029983 RepID=A0A291QVT4_9BACT|nr:tRNA (adenosine(37)-N6)-dimethylallyltransferase MiaA [Chitinophaga caeni]ATL48047.1 tRNA (adenosine(37)-N6)-dimethylallyltransferase MiaA [Chitinophaga caeni]